MDRIVLNAYNPFCHDPGAFASGGGGRSATTCSCADGDGSSACRGDSGGPVTIRKAGNEVLLAGLVSWGHKKCDVPKKCNVFQRLPMVTEFIEKTTGIDFVQ